MSNNKQTAVEWYNEQLNLYGDMAFNKEITLGQYHIKKQELFQQAKAMHEQEVQTAYWEGGQDVPMTSKQCEQYYTETFNSDEA